jgi:ribonuclease P protein component
MDDGAASGSGRHKLPAEARITRSEEIRALFRRGKRRKTRSLDVFISASPVSRSRVGLVVPKPRASRSPDQRRVHGAAVQRNRLKRRLREISRTEILPFLEEGECRADVLIRCRPEAYAATFDGLREELLGLREWMCSSVR